jgi:hypothetical protein
MTKYASKQAIALTLQALIAIKKIANSACPS